MKLTILAGCVIAIAVAGCGGNQGLVSPEMPQDAERPVLAKPAKATAVSYTMTQTGVNVGDPPADMKFTGSDGLVWRNWVNEFELNGDLSGTATAILDGSFANPNSPNATWGRTSTILILEITDSALGLSGRFEGKLTGKMRGGTLTDEAVLHGSGGFAGMHLKATGTIPYPPPDPSSVIVVEGLIW